MKVYKGYLKTFLEYDTGYGTGDGYGTGCEDGNGFGDEYGDGRGAGYGDETNNGLEVIA